MSTPNFNKKNASKYYAVELQDEYDYDVLKENLHFEFQDTADFWENNGEGKVVAQIVKCFNNWEITFNIIIRSGYYDGANLDWDVIVKDTRDYTEYYYGDYEEKELPQCVNNWITSKIKKVEKIFAQYSTPLVCKGIFSNGEAIYEKAK